MIQRRGGRAQSVRPPCTIYAEWMHHFSGGCAPQGAVSPHPWGGVFTNAIEGFNRQLRKVTKAKSVFPTDDSLFKMLYLAMMDITKKWTGRRQDWSRIHAQLSIYFADRMPD